MFRCPIWNIDPMRRPDVEGEFRLRCQVCGLRQAQLQDMDTRAGYLLVDVTFGPNMLDGVVNEDDIFGYAVFLTDLAGNRLTTAVAQVDPANKTAEFCCRENAYTARVATKFPQGRSQVLLEIVPVTQVGPLPAGLLTNAVVDNTFRTAAAKAHRHASPGGPAATLAFAFLLAMPAWALASAAAH